MSDARPEQNPGPWNFVAAVAAWVMPGLGHLLLGHVKRGVILAVTIGLLWTGGLAIGGITVIDRRAQPFWFLGQMLVGPSLAVEAGHRSLLDDRGQPQPGQNPAFTPSFGRVYEQGTLYTALAGLLNLMAILDVLYRKPRRMANGGWRMADGAEGARRPDPTHANSSSNRAKFHGPADPSATIAHPPSAIRHPPFLLPLLAWRPLLDPLPVDGYWLYIPLVILVAVVYKTIKLEDLRRLPRDATVLALQITVCMGLIAVAIWLLVELV